MGTKKINENTDAPVDVRSKINGTLALEGEKEIERERVGCNEINDTPLAHERNATIRTDTEAEILTKQTNNQTENHSFSPLSLSDSSSSSSFFLSSSLSSLSSSSSSPFSSTIAIPMQPTVTEETIDTQITHINDKSEIENSKYLSAQEDRDEGVQTGNLNGTEGLQKHSTPKMKNPKIYDDIDEQISSLVRTYKEKNVDDNRREREHFTRLQEKAEITCRYHMAGTCRHGQKGIGCKFNHPVLRITRKMSEVYGENTEIENAENSKANIPDQLTTKKPADITWPGGANMRKVAKAVTIIIPSFVRRY